MKRLEPGSPVLLLAQAAPIRIFTGKPEAPGRDWTPVIIAAAAGALLLLILLIVWRRVRARRQAKDPQSAAFAALARGLKLSRADQALTRELALKAGVPSPVALLASGGAFDCVMQSTLGRGVPADQVRRVRRLGVRLGWLTDAAESAALPLDSIELKSPKAPTKPPFRTRSSAAPGSAGPVSNPAAGGAGSKPSVPGRARRDPGQR